MLTSKQRSNLRSIASRIEPITQVGKLGVNESLIESLDKAIEKRELIKVTVLENSEFIDYSLHGLLHGNYDENGKLINEAEGYNIERLADGSWKKELVSDEYFNEHLDAFMKLYETWGFKKPLTTYIAPCGMGGITEEEFATIKSRRFG